MTARLSRLIHFNELGRINLLVNSAGYPSSAYYDVRIGLCIEDDNNL